MVDYDVQRDVMNKPFNIMIHKNTFVNYLEVVIYELCTVHYGVPSHREWLEQYACNKLKISKVELYKTYSIEYLFDLVEWLTKITGCVAVWDISYTGNLNYKQKSTLQLLKLEGLYKGEI